MPNYYSKELNFLWNSCSLAQHKNTLLIKGSKLLNLNLINLSIKYSISTQHDIYFSKCRVFQQIRTRRYGLAFLRSRARKPAREKRPRCEEYFILVFSERKYTPRSLGLPPDFALTYVRARPNGMRAKSSFKRKNFSERWGKNTPFSLRKMACCGPIKSLNIACVIRLTCAFNKLWLDFLNL